LGPWGGYVEKRAMKPREASRLCFDIAGCTRIKTTLIFLNYQFEAILKIFGTVYFRVLKSLGLYTIGIHSIYVYTISIYILFFKLQFILHRLRVFENRVVRISGPKRDDIIGS
jgi:hypothetical protein